MPHSITIDRPRVSRGAAGLREIQSSAPSAIGAFAIVVAVASAEGGHAASSWNWATLALAWVLLLALTLRREITLSRAELAGLGLLAAFVCMVGLSVVWSDDRPQSILELQRALLYLAAVATVLLGVRARSVKHLLGGMLTAIVAVCAYAVLTRLLSPSLDAVDPTMSSRLSGPIGYWNALGIFGAMGLLLALGFAAQARSLLARVASAGALPILAVTIFLTFSRGAWLGLAIGAVATVALDPQRLRLLTTAVVVGPASVLAVWLTSSSEALTRLAASEAAIVSDGRALAPIVLALVVASALACAVLTLAARQIRVPPAARRAYVVALLAAAVALGAVALASAGGPSELADRAYASFAGAEGERELRLQPGDDLSGRLSSLGSNGRADAWGATLDQWQAAPLLGTGAGTFEQHWLRERDARIQLRDAHSLYLESLAELGVVGLALLVSVLATPFAALARARKRRLGAAVFGAYLAFAAHAGIDWDWEIPAVTITGLVLGASLLRMGSWRDSRLRPAPLLRPALASLLVVLAGVSTMLLVGNRAVTSAREHADAARWVEAREEAETATRWLPWSGEAWQQLGRAQLGLGRRHEARESLRTAARKDPGEWRVHYDLATASAGEERRRAYRTAAGLNPLAVDVENVPNAGQAPAERELAR